MVYALLIKKYERMIIQNLASLILNNSTAIEIDQRHQVHLFGDQYDQQT